jgi:NitT/TauT family transport system ATP-binding protein
LIEIENLSKLFPGKRDSEPVLALQDVNLTVRDNEFLTILGPSGCGKTTLLRLIAGLLHWDDGEIKVDGKPVRGPGAERAMVFQSFALLPWMSVLDNVAFGLEIAGVPKQQRYERANELVEIVGLTGFEKRYPMELSGGMQQRVGLARALAVKPKVLLMDEPFGALDEQTRRLLQEELLAIWEKERTTVVFITHSMEEAVLLGDRVVLMSARPGRIEQIVDVPLARPRSTNIDSVEGSPAFTAITQQLWARLRDMQVTRRHKADGRHAAPAPTASGTA